MDRYVISDEEFRRATGFPPETVNLMKRLNLVPMHENGEIDFARGWLGLVDHWEKIDWSEARRVYSNLPEAELRAVARRDVERALSRSPSNPVRPTRIDEGDDSEFFSPEGREAFARAARAGSIKIKGQQIRCETFDPEWKREGFLTEEGFLAYNKAIKNGSARIFEGRG